MRPYAPHPFSIFNSPFSTLPRLPLQPAAPPYTLDAVGLSGERTSPRILCDKTGTALGVRFIRLGRAKPAFRVFDGGLFLSPLAEPGRHEPVQDFPCPPRLLVPMAQHAGPACEPVVSVGQQVSEGQLIGRANAPGALAVHAPRAGRVAAFASTRTAWSATTGST